MTEQPSITQEPLPSSEKLFDTADQMIALHVRMALSGDTLNPEKKDLPEVGAEQLTSLSGSQIFH